MEELSKYNLAFGLFKSIVIFNQNNAIVLAGEEIKKMLAEGGLDLHAMIKDHVSNPEGRRLIQTLDQVRNDKLAIQAYTFEALNREFILFPANPDKLNTI